MLLVSGPAASGVVGGLAAVGDLVGLDGHLLAPGQGAGAVLLAWVTALVPTWNGRERRARACAPLAGRSAE